jgi:hypothetical protein
MAEVNTATLSKISKGCEQGWTFKPCFDNTISQKQVATMLGHF